jgi:hypothetical protein
MNNPKKIAKWIGIGTGILVVVIVFAFTNIDDLLLQELTEYTSEVKLTNPVQSYEINTECDFVHFLLDLETGGEMLRFLQQNSDVIQQKLFEKGVSFQKSEYIQVIKEISAKMVMEEFSINPKLKNFVTDSFSEPSTQIWLSKVKLLGSDCSSGLLENQNFNIYTVYAKNPMKPTLQDGDDVVVDKNIQLTDLKEGDIIVYKSNLETHPFRFSRVIVADPDSGNISTKLDMQQYPIHHDYPNGKNEFIGKVTEIIRDGKKIPLPPYTPESTESVR